MGGAKKLALIIFPIILLCLKFGSCDPAPHLKLLPSDILDSYRSFSYAILRDKYTRKAEDIGAAGYSTLGLGQLLAVVNEQLWPVDTYGFDSALKIPKSKIYSSYQQILASLTNDKDVTLYSDIYTSRHGFQGPDSLEGLKTKISYVDYNTTSVNVNSVVAEINARIVVQTFAKIYGTLVPLGGWWGLPFFNYTQAVLTNTFHFKAHLANSLRSTLQQPFEDSSGSSGVEKNVTFFETTGLPLHSPNDNYVAVRIPFKVQTTKLQTNNIKTDFGEPNKAAHFIGKRSVHISFVQKPSLDFTQGQCDNIAIVKNDLEGHLRKVYTDTRVEKTVTIRIPAMNFTNIPNSYFRQLKKLGVTESFCRYGDMQKKNVLESIAQNVHVSLTPDFLFQVAVATGSHLNNVQEFLNIHSSDLEPQIQEDEGNSTSGGSADAEVNKETLAKLRFDLFSDDGEIRQRDLAIKNKSKINNNNYKNKNNGQGVKNKQGINNKNSAEKMEQPQQQADDEVDENTTDEPVIDGKRSIVNFNRPFFYYLDDDILGPVFFGSVTSFQRFKKHQEDVPLPGQEWQDEGMKYLLWSCP